MPTYEFVCQECTTVFSISGKYEAVIGRHTCPNCGSDDVQRKYSGVPSIFKSKGFYKTDNKKVS